MKNRAHRNAILLFILFISTSIYAQKKIGYVVQLDSILKQVHLGMTSFTNFSSIYSLPFELNTYCDQRINRTFEEENIKLIKIDPQLYQGFLKMKEDLSKKEFKVYQKEWLENLKNEYQIDGLMVFESAILEPYQQENIATDLGRIAMIHENNMSYVKVYINMKCTLFTEDKGKDFTGKTKFQKKDDFPGLRSKTTRYTEEEIGLLETPLQELIRIQLEEIKESKGFIKLMD